MTYEEIQMILQDFKKGIPYIEYYMGYLFS